MAQDYAKKRRTGSTAKRRSTRKKSASGRATSGPSGWRWFTGGLLTGVFLSFLVYLGTLPPGVTPAGESNPAQQPQDSVTVAAEPPKPRFDFYKMLPEQSIDADIDTDTSTPQESRVAESPAATSSQYYLLQAGSFRQREDAERRRAELLLLGLEPSIEETTGSNGRWYRVYVGPFESRSKMAKARSLTASQDIDTLLLKRNKPG